MSCRDEFAHKGHFGIHVFRGEGKGKPSVGQAGVRGGYDAVTVLVDPLPGPLQVSGVPEDPVQGVDVRDPFPGPVYHGGQDRRYSVVLEDRTAAGIDPEHGRRDLFHGCGDAAVDLTRDEPDKAGRLDDGGVQPVDEGLPGEEGIYVDPRRIDFIHKGVRRQQVPGRQALRSNARFEDHAAFVSLSGLLFFRGNAYFNISFEREAYKNEYDYDYLEQRKHFSWIKYMRKKKGAKKSKKRKKFRRKLNKYYKHNG